jgi:hypothetical protein
MKHKEYTARLTQRWQPGKRNKANDLSICAWNVVSLYKPRAQIIEKTTEYNIETHHLFIDFRTAYDTIIKCWAAETSMDGWCRGGR